MGFLRFGQGRRSRAAIADKIIKSTKPNIDLIERMLIRAHEGLEALPWKGNEKRHVDVLHEFVYFDLHMTDRIAFGRISEEQRGKAIGDLEATAIRYLIATGLENIPPEGLNFADEGIKFWQSFFREHLEARVALYSKCSLDWQPNMKGFIFWEFAKNVAKAARHEEDAFWVNPAFVYARSHAPDQERDALDFVRAVLHAPH